jgi:ATP-dependent DNA ligase
MASSLYIRAMHPKTEISADPSAMARILEKGWIAQTKIHGHRAQIHVSHDPKEPVVVYNRQGKRHAKELSPSLVKEIRRLFQPAKGWNVIDAEWLKPEEKLFVFDFLKLEGELLWRANYLERFNELPKNFLSPHLSVLPLIRDLPGCLKVMQSTQPHIEGLVFKATSSAGFSDTSIVRCRRR